MTREIGARRCVVSRCAASRRGRPVARPPARRLPGFRVAVGFVLASSRGSWLVVVRVVELVEADGRQMLHEICVFLLSLFVGLLIVNRKFRGDDWRHVNSIFVILSDDRHRVVVTSRPQFFES